MTNPIEPKDVGMYWLETNRELDALFRKNLAPVEVDIDRLWVGIEYRLTPKKEKSPAWRRLWNRWMDLSPLRHQAFWAWQRPMAVTATFVLFLFSVWILRDQTHFNQQVQLLKQIDTTWSETGQLTGEDNPFVLSEEAPPNINPFDRASS